MATAAPAAPRENGRLFLFLLWIPSKIPWSPHRPSSCHLWTHPLTCRRALSWAECLSTTIIHKLQCQILYRRRCRERKWRRRRRESWLCCLWEGGTCWQNCHDKFTFSHCHFRQSKVTHVKQYRAAQIYRLLHILVKCNQVHLLRYCIKV